MLTALTEASCFGKGMSKRPKVRAAACEILGHLQWRKHGATGFWPEEDKVAAAKFALVGRLDDRDEGVRLQAPTDGFEHSPPSRLTHSPRNIRLTAFAAHPS